MTKNAYAAIWSDDVPADRVDPDAFLFMGCAEWTPDREYKSPDGPDAAPEHCLLCGGAGVPVEAMDGRPIVDPEGNEILVAAITPGSRRVCARCMRSGRGPARQLWNTSTATAPATPPEVPVPCPDDPGYVERDGVKVPERFARLMKG